MKNIELRFNSFENVVDENDGKLRVSGYVNEVEKFSHTLGTRKKFREKICRGTFKRALEKGNDIHFLAEHDDNKILASTRNNSLTLVEDDKGLFMTAEISPTSYGKDYHTLINDGILRNMSFGFSVDKDKWKKSQDGIYIREITDLTLYEVSVVTNPAYPQSSIQARGMSLVNELEIPSDIEVEEVMEEIRQEETVEVEKTDETVETKKEARAYINYIWEERDFLNCVMNIIADSTSILQYAKENADKVSESDAQVLKDCIKTCTNIITNANESRSAETEKEEVREVTEVEEKEVSEEVTEKEEKEKEVIVEEEVKDEETVEETVEEKEETEETEERSIDLSEYYNILDRL